MSEFQSRTPSPTEGAPPGYVGYGKGGKKLFDGGGARKPFPSRLAHDGIRQGASPISTRRFIKSSTRA